MDLEILVVRKKSVPFTGYNGFKIQINVSDWNLRTNNSLYQQN